jgi:regulator of RNase E activity RraA
MPFQANVPEVLDRVAVMPGHYVFADSSGAVVIPDVQIEEVIARHAKSRPRTPRPDRPRAGS